MNALPTLLDCTCACSQATTVVTSDQELYPLSGTDDPNTAGVTPPYRTDEWWSYYQLFAPTGPVSTTWYWNPFTLTWV